uniref:DNA/RNA non-specific endonuclease domain-containing protein n=1 Tax=Glossina brevipalpis TaxID=37001 RepID=A0A1A9X2I0_9MUSC
MLLKSQAEKNGQTKSMGLENSNDYPKHRIPKFIYKLVVDTKTKDGIVFVTLNDPYHNNPASKNLCKDRCGEANINEPDFKNVEKGYTICCTYGDFKESVRTLPKDIQVKGLLKY